jgi:hypothetical protein
MNPAFLLCDDLQILELSADRNRSRLPRDREGVTLRQSGGSYLYRIAARTPKPRAFFVRGSLEPS